MKFISRSLLILLALYGLDYSAEVTGTPDVLASALVKIAYGMVRAEGEILKAMKKDEKNEEAKREARRAQRIAGTVAVMGISNARSGASIILGGADPAAAAALLRWGLVNPRARFY